MSELNIYYPISSKSIDHSLTRINSTLSCVRG